MLIDRDLVPRLHAAANRWPAVTLTGPRQSGKTTLCRSLFADRAYVSLEEVDARQFATEDPRGFLAAYPNGAVIDEIQRAPDLLSYLQGIIDDGQRPGQWILTGSHHLALTAGVSQSLAGRTAVLTLLPLARSELVGFAEHPRTLDASIAAGGYPAIFEREIEPAEWLSAYVSTYIERDVRTVTNVGDLAAFTRFVQLCAGRCGQLLNYASLAADCGISQPTAKAWLSILQATYIVFTLPPYHANNRKRLVKMPKLHFYDSGLACWLLGIREPAQLSSHPLRGALFETWVVSEIAKHEANHGSLGRMFHYRERNGAEVDLLLERADSMTLVEAKASMTPSGRLLDTASAAGGRLADSGGVPWPIVVYGGESDQHRQSGDIISWRRLHHSPHIAPRADA
ncbi:MAG: ATP-binding protein [Acidimicrobiaceae bacterium]|nr:ATP-binding protein [Acidimicrobiaceae bacterium]